MDIAFTGGSDSQRRLVHQAVAAINDRHLNLDAFGHTWQIEFLAPGVIDTTPHDAFKTFMVTQNDGRTQIRDDMPFSGRGPFAGTAFFQESVVHELAHHLLGNGPNLGYLSADEQQAIAQLFDSDPSDWNPQDKRWEDRPVEGIAETFKDSFLSAGRREYFNRTNQKLPIHQYPSFRGHWRAATAANQTIDADHASRGTILKPFSSNDYFGEYPYLPEAWIPEYWEHESFPPGSVGTHFWPSDTNPGLSKRARLATIGDPEFTAGSSTEDDFGGGVQIGSQFFNRLQHFRPYERSWFPEIFGPVHITWTEEHTLEFSFSVDPAWFVIDAGRPFSGQMSVRVALFIAGLFNGAWEWRTDPGSTPDYFWVRSGDAGSYDPPPLTLNFSHTFGPGETDPFGNAGAFPTSLPFFDLSLEINDYIHGVSQASLANTFADPSAITEAMADAIPLLSLSDPGIGPGAPTTVPEGYSKAVGGNSGVREHIVGPG